MARIAGEQSLLDTTALNFALAVVMAHRSRHDGTRMTNETVAKEAGINEATLSNLRAGSSGVSINNALRLLTWLGDLPVSQYTRPKDGECAVCGRGEPVTLTEAGAA